LSFAQTPASNLCGLLTYWDGSLVPLFPSAPIPWPADADKVCPTSITSTGETCCNDEVFAQIRYLYHNISGEIQNVQSAINSIWGDLATTLQNWWNNLPQETKNTIKQADPNIETQIQNLENFLNDFPNDYTRCIHALFRYWLGMFCLVCSNNPLQYIDTSTTPITISIAQSTCDNVYTECNPLVQLIVNVQNVNGQNVPGTGSLCADATSCKNFICNNFIQGVGTNVNGINSGSKKAILAMTGVTQSTGSNTYCSSSSCYDAYGTGKQSGLAPGTNTGFAVRPILAFVFFFALVALLL